jgi:hypothetical protein
MPLAVASTLHKLGQEHHCQQVRKAALLPGALSNPTDGTADPGLHMLSQKSMSSPVFFLEDLWQQLKLQHTAACCLHGCDKGLYV